MGARAIAYYRVSARGRGRVALTIETLREAVTRFAVAEGIKIFRERVEVEAAGEGDNLDRRPELRAALDEARRCHCPILIAMFSQLSNNADFLSEMMAQGVPFVIAQLSADGTPFIIRPFVFAKKERALISQRTTAALAAAKARGIELGNRTNLAQVRVIGRATARANADQFARNVLTIVDRIRVEGIGSFSGIANALNIRGVRSRRGGQWYPTTVSNLLARQLPALEDDRKVRGSAGAAVS